MNLFENETLSISKIHTICLYGKREITEKKLKFNVCLPSYELIFILSGQAIVHFSGVDIVDSPDVVRYLPKGIENGEYTVDVDEAEFCIDIYFDTQDPMPDKAMSFKNFKELRPLFEKIHEIWNAKSEGYYMRAMAVLYEIIAKIKVHNESYLESSRVQKILPAQKYALEHFCDNDFDYKEMCRKTGLSYDYFKELFIKKYGVSPVKYVTALRLEKAKELLITGLYSVGEIAAMCGFDNLYYFSTTFKKHFGCSPKNYKGF